MKYLIILLLLSMQGFGQNRFEQASKQARQATNEELRRIAKEAAIKTDEKVFVWQSHTHKWVELHQDTVEATSPDDFIEPWAMSYKHVSEMFNTNERWRQTIHLICLICHEEKRKIIHYKKRG